MKRIVTLIMLLATVTALCGVLTLHAFAGSGVQITNGTPNDAHGTISVAAAAAPSDPVSVTATPEEGYGLNDLKVYQTGNPSVTVEVDASTLTFEMPDYPVTVEGTFFNVSFLDETVGTFGTRYTEEIEAIGAAFRLSPKALEAFLNEWAGTSANAELTLTDLKAIPKTNEEARLYTVLNILVFEDYFRTKTVSDSRIDLVRGCMNSDVFFQRFAQAIGTFSANPSDYAWLTFYRQTCDEIKDELCKFTEESDVSLSGVHAALNQAKTAKPAAAASGRDALYQTALWFSNLAGSPFTAAELSTATDNLIARMIEETSFGATASKLSALCQNASDAMKKEYAAEAFVFSIRVLAMINGGDRVTETVGPVTVAPFLTTALDDSGNYFYSIGNILGEAADCDYDGIINLALNSTLIQTETNVLCEGFGLPAGLDNAVMMNYLYGFNLSAFVDPFRDAVNVDTYSTYDGGTYAKSRGYVLQGFYTGVDGKGDKLNGTPVGGTVYYAFYKTSDGRPVVTTPLDFSLTATKEHYATAEYGIQYIAGTGGNRSKVVLSNVTLDVFAGSNGIGIFFESPYDFEIVGKVEVIVHPDETLASQPVALCGIRINSGNDLSELYGVGQNASLSVETDDFTGQIIYGIYCDRLRVKDLTLTVKTGLLTSATVGNSISNFAVDLSTRGIFENCEVTLLAGACKDGDPETDSSNAFVGGALDIIESNILFTGHNGAIYEFDDGVTFKGVDVMGSDAYNDASANKILRYVYRYQEEYYRSYRVDGTKEVVTLKTVVHYEAKIGNKQYTTLQKAVDDAQPGDTVVLLQDLLLVKSISIKEDDVIILDLAGHALGLTAEEKVLPLFTSLAPGFVGRSYDSPVIFNEGILTLTDSGNDTNVHYIVTGPNGNTWMLKEGDEGFDLSALTFLDPYGNSYSEDPLSVSKVYGGVIGPNNGTGIINLKSLTVESVVFASCPGAISNGVERVYEETDTDICTATVINCLFTDCNQMQAYNGGYSRISAVIVNQGVFTMTNSKVEKSNLYGIVNQPHEDRPTQTGIFNMTDCTVTGTARGFYAMEGSKQTFAGKIVIENNIDENDKQANLLLGKDAKITFDAAKGLDASSVIYVSTEVKPTASASVPVTVPETANYTSVFKSENGAYLVRREENATVLVLLHVTEEPTAANDYTVKANADDVTYQWYKVLPNLQIGAAYFATEQPQEGSWKDGGAYFFANPYNVDFDAATGTLTAKTFMDYGDFWGQRYGVELLYNDTVLKKGDVLYFTCTVDLALAEYYENAATVENLGNNLYKLTVGSTQEVLLLVENYTRANAPETPVAFTISNIHIPQAEPLAGETSATIGEVTEIADFFCRVTRDGAYADSAVITPVKVSFAGGEAEGTAPADQYNFAGRTVTLPANTFTFGSKTFCAWDGGTLHLPAGASYSFPTENLTFTAVFKSPVTLDSEVEAFTYDGTAHAYTVKGTDAGLGLFTVSYLVGGAWTEEAPVAAGKYDVRITRAEDDTYVPVELTVEGGLVIKAVEMSTPTEQPDEKPEVIVKTDDGFPTDVTVVVEVTVESDIREELSKDNLSVDYNHIEDENAKLQRNEKVGVIFDVKLIRTVNGVTEEIQPEDIAVGTKIRVKMLIPASVDVSKVTRILHVHAAGDIEVIEFNPELIDENGYYEIEIDRLSEFAFIYESDNVHWIVLALLAALLAFVAVLWFALKIRTFKTEEKLNLAPVIGFAVHFVGVVVLAFFALCALCWILLGVNVLALAFFVALYLGAFKHRDRAEKVKTEKGKTEEVKTEEPKTEKASAPAENAPVSSPVTPVVEEMSLKDAIACAVASANTSSVVNKETVANFLRDSYGDSVEVNRRANYISSGILPLADTHYKMLEGGKKCFIYVYELTGGKVFFLVRANEFTATEIQKKHPAFTHSAYPKAKEHDWYTMLLDSTFASAAEVFDTLAFVFENFAETKTVALRSSVDVLTAHTLFSNAEIDFMMEDGAKHTEVQGKEAIVNVDTLSEQFEDGAEIDLTALKEKKLVPQNAKRLKVLARGTLTKKFTVTANAFSYDAAKMILALGGKFNRI